MCGIAGILNLDQTPVPISALRSLTDALSHRGPDGEGIALLDPSGSAWSDYTGQGRPDGAMNSPCGLAHRRLAIIDLSPAGLQPRSNRDASVWIAFNGEIYNYLELRGELESLGRSFDSATDTEVLLQAYEEWGLECLDKFNGMWAFAIWDKRRRTLVLCRDRFGIKPLYWTKDTGRFAFASEPKALLKLSGVSSEPDPRAIADYLVHSREDCFSWTFFKSISQLEPGHYLEIPLDARELPRPRRWWHIENTLSEAVASDSEAESQFKELFESSVSLRLRSDVPIGTCLSGGLDSSAIVCVSRPSLKEGDQHSYSAVYGSDFALDETEFINHVADFAKIENHKCYPTAESFLEDYQQLLYHQDEPFGSTSQYAQYKVFQLARRHGTTVTLDGQGADELLAGYHYLFPVHVASLLRSGRLITAAHEFSAYRSVTSGPLVRSILETAAGFFSHRTMIRLANYYDRGRSTDWVHTNLIRNARSIQVSEENPFTDSMDRRLYDIFSSSGLPALLRYEDRNSMAFGIEARLPFLDHRLVSFAFSQPSLRKIRNGQTKYIFRQAMNGVIPNSIRERSDKIGFATPEASWFRGPLYSHFRDLFDSKRTRDRGLYRIGALLKMLDENAAGRVDAGRALWRAYNLESWFRAFID